MNERERFDQWWETANTRMTDLPKEQAWWIWSRARADLKRQSREGYIPAPESERPKAL